MAEKGKLWCAKILSHLTSNITDKKKWPRPALSTVPTRSLSMDYLLISGGDRGANRGLRCFWQWRGIIIRNTSFTNPVLVTFQGSQITLHCEQATKPGEVGHWPNTKIVDTWGRRSHTSPYLALKQNWADCADSRKTTRKQNRNQYNTVFPYVLRKVNDRNGPSLGVEEGVLGFIFAVCSLREKVGFILRLFPSYKTSEKHLKEQYSFPVLSLWKKPYPQKITYYLPM